jgi:hypothetical protein
MKNIKHIIPLLLWGMLLTMNSQTARAQSSPNCETFSDNDYIKSTAFFNYGNVSNAYTNKTRTYMTVGQPLIGSYFAQQTKGSFGFWSTFLMPPAAPTVIASEGDLEDRVQVNWSPDPLSPAATAFKIYRDGALLASVDGETFSFLDFNVIAGRFYTYEVAGVNSFGEGARGKNLGFLNPNGVVTGQVKSFAGNPVPGTLVTLTPTIGTSGIFGGDDMAFAEYNPAYPRNQFTLSAWVKLGVGNDGAAIFDLGSTISKNWWLHTLPATSGKGVRFCVGNGVGNVTELDYAFPVATANDWHNIAVSYNGSSLLLYADGELISTAVAQIASDSIPLFFGQKIDGSGSFTGGIDEVRFFNRQLAQTEIQMFLNTTVAPDMNGLVNYWKFDEGTGTKTFDLTAAKQKLYFCGAGFATDKPDVANAGMTNADGFYKIPGINYAAGTTFTARPSKNFYYNQSLEFNGVNEQFATLTDFDLADSSTVEITVKGFDFASNQTLLNKGSHFSLNLNAGNLVLTLGGTTHDFGALDMEFHRLTFVIDQVAGSSSAAVTFYKDGALAGSHTFSGVAADFSGGGGWLLGKNAGGNYFSGLIDEVVFYNTLLSLPNIQLAANVGTNVTNQKLSNFFSLNEGEGEELSDFGLSLTGKGTVSGATWSTGARLSQVEPRLYTPSTRFVTLNPSVTSVDGIDFTDQSTIPVSGYVRFDGTDCFQEGVEILVNGQRNLPPVFTDSTGYFSLDLEPGESVQLSPVFKKHTYFPAFWEIEKIASPVAGILFRNQTQRSIEGQMAGNEVCRKSVIPTGAIVKVAVETLDGCYYQEKVLTNPNGKYKFDKLPPLPFLVKVTEHSNNVIYNYFQLKGGEKVDLTDVNDTTDFIYYSAPIIEMTPFDTNACGVPMLEQDNDYRLDVRVYQQYDGGRCYLDTAQLHFENLIEGTELDTLMTGGKLKYEFRAGFPNIVAPYFESLTVEAEAFQQLNTYSQLAVVLGKRPRLVNFTSTSPSIPLVILRDPPGDASYATIEKGETFCNEWSMNFSTTAKAEAGLELDLGTEAQIIKGTPKVGKIITTGFSNSVEITASASTSFAVNESMEVCMTTTEVFSTSDGDVIVGEDADVFVGGALNILFGATDDLVWDTLACSFRLDTGVLVYPGSFATTFIYSAHQIKTVVIPNLLLVGDTVSANEWRYMLNYNKRLREQAIFERNISFDAGVAYENTTSVESTKSSAYEFGVEIGLQFQNEFGFNINKTGATFKWGMELGFSTAMGTTNTETRSKTVTYALGDDDIGDNFTVDILQDRVYGTPVFKTISGNSSCPYEPKTVNRDEVSLTVDKTIAVNVLENDAATFKFTLGNTSQTSETREYLFSLIPESNPLGAVVKIQGGSPLDRPFGLAFQQGQEVTVTVERDNRFSPHVYEDLEFAIFAECEDSRGVALGLDAIDPKFYKSILLDVNFLEPCSSIDIGFPLQNWVWTIADGDSIFITLNDFNRADTDLELIRVQFRRKNGDGAWINIIEVPKAQLDNDVFKIIKWGTQDLADGEYEIRAVTQCFGGQNAGISHVISGRFERQSPALFGTPEPADGVLGRGDEISIRFNEPIRCDQLIQADVFNNNNIGLYDTETDQLIDAIISCQGDKIVIVPNVPNRFIENKVLRVEVNNIKDLANNVFVEKKWEFFVDRNPIRWEGGNIKVNKLKPEFVTVTRRILNDGGQATSWELEDVPTWVRVYPSSGVLLPSAAEDITFEFDSTLVFGNYLDTIRIIAPEGNEPLIVNCRVLCESPAEWKGFDPAAYPHTMNFSLKLDVEGTLSTDEQDIVAAFIDGELRGTARVQLLPTLPPLGTQYMAFLTVYGDSDDDGKPVKLEIWDASACLRYGEVIEQFDFEVDNVIGTIGTPTVLHTNSMVRRDIALTTGWNWISFNLLHPDPSLNASLASLKYPANDLIKGQSSFSEYFGGNWIGSLAAVNNRNMFQFRADQPDTIQMRGALIDPASLSIPISAGWNWVGYVPNYALTVTQALAGLTPLNGDIIKGQTAFAQYIAGFGWLGSLQFMEPPHGYQLKISNAGTLTYPPQPQNKPSTEPHPSLLTPRSSLWEVDATQYEHSMTLVGMLSAGGQNTTLAGHEIGAFVGGQLRGSAKAIYIEPLDAYAFFLTTFANTSGEQLQFKLYDSATGAVQDLVEKMYFVADLHQGGVQSPVPFTLKTSGLADIKSVQYLEVQPNPFSDATTILFAADHAQEVRLLISDATGRTVLSQKIAAAQGLNQFRWEATSSASAGVYFVRLETGEGTAVRKVVKE